MTDPWLTTAQALQEFGISPSTLKDWAARGWVEAHRPDRRSLRVHRASLEARLANRPKRGPKPKEESMATHVTHIEGPDTAGHYEWVCCCGANATGYEAFEVAEMATAHGPLAANSMIPVDEED